MARFKELCIDTNGAGGELGRFWAAATGCTYAPPGPDAGEGDVGDVLGPVEGMGIAMCPVPEPKTVKHRVHLDVHTASVESLLALGARRAPGYGGDAWTVLLDPEGGEFCAFIREGDLPGYLGYELVVDSRDAQAQARWWADVFDLESGNDGEAYWHVSGIPDLPFESVVFDPVPEPKTVKNRIHWDLYGDVAEFTHRGATVLRELRGWAVLADPEGNEFCVFPDSGP